MALRSARGAGQAIGRACEWLSRRQRRDGGWSPGAAVEQSTHVTSLALLALSQLTGFEDPVDRGIHWLLGQSGAETSLFARIALFASGTASDATDHHGWPWFPGAAAWVIPTSLAICALSRHTRGSYANQIPSRIDEGVRFLLSRRCPDQGWNHGGLFRPGEVPVSYPETTGLALLALAAAGVQGLESSVLCGERHASDPKSGDGELWLKLGLRAQGRNFTAPRGKFRDWTVHQAALRIIADSEDADWHPFVGHA
jgi:hypothetical protein